MNTYNITKNDTYFKLENSTSEYVEASVDRLSVTLCCYPYALHSDLFDLLNPEDDKTSFEDRLINLSKHLESVFDEKGLSYKAARGQHYKKSYSVSSCENDTESMHISFGSASDMSPANGVRIQWNPNKLDILDEKYRWLLPLFYQLSTCQFHHSESWLKSFIRWSGIDIAIDIPQLMYPTLWGGFTKDAKFRVKEKMINWYQFGSRGADKYYRVYDKLAEIIDQWKDGKNVEIPDVEDWWRCEVSWDLSKKKAYLFDDDKIIEDDPFKNFTYKDESFLDPMKVWTRTKDKHLFDVASAMQFLPYSSIDDVPFFLENRGIISRRTRQRVLTKVRDVSEARFEFQPSKTWDLVKKKLINFNFSRIQKFMSKVVDEKMYLDLENIGLSEGQKSIILSSNYGFTELINSRKQYTQANPDWEKLDDLHKKHQANDVDPAVQKFD